MSGVTGTTLLTVTAPTLQSIAVTPPNPTITTGEDRAIHGDRYVLRQLDAGSDQPGDLGIGDARDGDDHQQRPGDRRGSGDVHITATMSGVTGTTLLTVTTAVPAVDRGDADQPEHRPGVARAVHGDRHVLRRLDGGSDEPGDLDIGDARDGDDQQHRPGDELWAQGMSTITATLSGVIGHDDIDGHCRDLAVDRGDAGEPEHSEG